ncbi:Fe-S-containing hydro-lyase [Clostridium aminobutyricum]|uniref:Fe-S-containing hydro-lyase n=1 Tax=Clostridium aminobutyricum TaxID=33953 RepID=A0A939D946_CLOAM|nr:Fe-S-containing hydro-lyase [Clostridium aminobutyricum]MBN7773400.1 Fe-S-containing hydro-lyase [Clostridium aminobutyricum]
MTEMKRLEFPFTKEKMRQLKAGESVLISGIIYTARDAAHKRLVEMLDRGEPLPFELEGSIIYYVGPTPEKPGNAIGSAGPTTSYRMDSYAPRLLDLGQAGMIGKGQRSKEVIDAAIRNDAVYFAAIGGAGALIARSIKESEIIAFEELGAEAIRKLKVIDFPAVVVIDSQGSNYYEIGTKEYLESL